MFYKLEIVFQGVLNMEKNKKESVFRKILKIIFCSAAEIGSGYIDNTFSLLTSVILGIIGYSMLVVSPFALGYAIYVFIPLWPWAPSFQSIFDGIMNIFMFALVFVVIFMFSILLIASAKEARNQKSHAKINEAFSGVISFVALIIALIALLK